MKVVEVAIGRLKRYPNNTRSITSENQAGLKASIKKFGILEPLVVSQRHGWILSGEQRWTVAKASGYKVAPVVYVTLTDDEEMALNIAMNNPGIQGVYTPGIAKLVQKLRRSSVALFDSLRLANAKAIDALRKGASQKAKNIEAMELQPYEHHDYVVILCENVADWNWLHSFLGLKRVNASPVGKIKIGLGRAVPFVQFKKRFDEHKKS